MDLKKAYNEIMEKIELTDDMRHRILDNIQNANLKEPAKITPIHSFKKYMSIAACFLVFLLGAITLPNLLQGDDMEQSPGILQPGADMVEATSIKELSEMLGFEVKNIAALPFEVTSTTYMSYWNEMAEITYSGEGQNAEFRMSMGDEDNSGDYTVYPSVIETTVNGNTITLKGSDDKYRLAVWTDEKYSYSILMSEGISQSEWLTVLEKIN